MAPSDDGHAGSPPGGVPERQRRRSLRAVFAADIAGFSGRMSLNETNTINALSEIRAIGRRALEKHNGWLFGMPGDGLFASFESAVNAVQCALEMQLDLSQRPHLNEMPLRVGIHLGEVILDDDIPYGETLNIAARLESLADPGGILVSGTVMDAVSARISARFEGRGVPILKNIPRRIPTFAVKQPAARSATDETQVGKSNLDKTTRLDRNALKELLGGQSAPAQSVPAPSPAQAPAPTPPPAAPSSEQATDRVDLAALSTLGKEKPPSSPAQSDASAPITSANQKPAASDQAPSLAQKIADLSPVPSPAPLNAPQPAEPPFKPHVAPPPATPLEKTLPDPVPASAPESNLATSAPSKDFVDEITKALAVHVGPFAKLIVERELKSNPNVFELISKLEEHVPNDDERLVFRVRASHINAAAKDSGSGA